MLQHEIITCKFVIFLFFPGLKKRPFLPLVSILNQISPSPKATKIPPTMKTLNPPLPENKTKQNQTKQKQKQNKLKKKNR